MKYSASHTFQVDAGRFVQLYFDDAFNNFLDEKLHIKERRLLEETEDEDTISREHLVFPDRQIPKALRGLVAGKKICYTEKRVLDKKNNVLIFSITPGILKGKIHCAGRFKVRSAGARSAIREAEGELSVDIPLIGKIAEKFIVKEIMKSFEQTAELTKEYFRKYG